MLLRRQRTGLGNPKISKDWRSLSIYQLITDRFADGDPRNNELFAEGFDVRDMTYRRPSGTDCRYAMLDFTLLDKRLGTLQELRDLINAAHDLGMYVIVDVFSLVSVAETKRRMKMLIDQPKKAALAQDESVLYDTPEGKQAYHDFWISNTWDPDATYNGTLYGQYGEWVRDSGSGTYEMSDFHHNGDLLDYFDPWQINFGKIYGTMDDLRLEHQRVQQKYIAMTKALIESCDIDAFRVDRDTPMQVPLNFYKAWAPEMRSHAKSLGKDRFGIWGEFYVTPARYATMTGRGRDSTMYGQDVFIDDIFTMKGGIVYPYYWYVFTAVVYKDPSYADGLVKAYVEENKMIDTLDPTTGRKEYAMWTFCNNHDNWRLQSMVNSQALRMCLAVITFWSGPQVLARTLSNA
eukprot:Skav223418  [mRNA]  locus=scaffold350:341424:346672:- [translate_table: standard]